MAALWGLLNLGLFIALIVGLIKPATVLRWTDKPTRLKVFSYWIVATIIVVIIGILTINEGDKAQSNLESAKVYIEQGKYESAITKLKDIGNENPLYSEAQQLLNQADSLSKVSEEEKRIANEVESKKADEDKKRKLKGKIETIIKAINEGIDYKNDYRGSVALLQGEISLFKLWAQVIKEGESYNDADIQDIAKTLKSKVENVQLKEFPILRKEYAHIAAKIMWENDIEVTVNGTSNKYINFSGGIFAANKNKQDFQNEVLNILKAFRFNQSRYRWYKGADEYTYWTIYEGKDSELVTD